MGPRIAYNLSNKEYHGDKSHHSSSQLKDMMEDWEVFYKNQVLGQKVPLKGSALDVGTYFHTAILEPHKLDEECAVWKGFRKGPEWTKFAEENSHKAIIADGAELKQAMNCINAVKNSPIAMDLIKRAEPEVSAFVTLEIYKGKIYYRSEIAGKGFNAKVLTPDGWSPVYLDPKANSFKMGVKVRADFINLDDSDLYIGDLKSASGNVGDPFVAQTKISDLNYDLSAGMYLDVFSAATGKNFKTFIWTFASKDLGICKNHRASPKMVRTGRAKWAKAVLDIAKYSRRNWKAPDDEMADLDPKEFELAWISRSDIFPEMDIEDEILEEETIEETTTTEESEEDLKRKQIIEEDLL